jgi:hypothetical protein
MKKKNLRRQNSAAIFRQVSPASLLGVTGDNSQNDVVTNQEYLGMRQTHNMSEIFTLLGSSCALPPPHTHTHKDKR